MKRAVYYILTSCICGFMLISACSREEIPEPDIRNDYPRILGGWPSYDSYGRIGVFNIRQNDTLRVSLQFTPAAMCKGVWYLQGDSIAEGENLEYPFTKTGVFRLKIEVTTPSDATYREANVIVRS